ncbi:MAG: NAD(P)H-dependent oxidoreductase [Succinivibrio sp.]|nr:NAD(P)H-dependent oxidoreductase [Succinivibrio sp.]
MGRLLSALTLICSFLLPPVASATAAEVLVAYFSRTGENYAVGVIDKGNTEIAAEMIAAQTGGTLFKIDPVKPYPEAYAACTEVAREELDAGARPEIKGDVQDFERYQVIFVGYPIWWGDMPMPVYTFLERHDFNGKTVIPFATHGGSKMGVTQAAVQNACKGAKVLEGLAITGKTLQQDPATAGQEIVKWLRQLGLSRGL